MNNKKLTLSLVVSVVVLASFYFWYYYYAGNLLSGAENNRNVENLFDYGSKSQNNIITMENGKLKITDVAIGAGEEAKPGNTLTIHYTGTFSDGKKFDSSLDRGEPIKFTLGAGQVIKGWDLGVRGMKVGGKRELIIEPDLGYGAEAVGPIPPNSTLLFSVELLKIE